MGLDFRGFQNYFVKQFDYYFANQKEYSTFTQSMAMKPMRKNKQNEKPLLSKQAAQHAPASSDQQEWPHGINVQIESQDSHRGYQRSQDDQGAPWVQKPNSKTISANPKP